MVTFFTTAKPFQGHSSIIQRNALKSCRLVHPNSEVIFFGDEEGAEDACRELGIRYEPLVERSHLNPKLPLAGHLFRRAQEIARHDWLCYINCDIILMPDFCEALRKLSRWREAFLMIGRRWDLNIRAPFDFERPNWDAELRREALEHGTRRNHEVDYFLFRKGMYRAMPPLIIGRVFWDYWTVWKARSLGLPVVEASPMVVVVHQDHGSAYVQETKMGQGLFLDPGAEWNYRLANNGRDFATFEDCTHWLSAGGTLLPTLWRKQRRRAKQLLWSTFVHKTFALRKRLGIRRSALDRFLGARRIKAE